MITSIAHHINRIISLISQWMHSIGIGVLVAMMFLTFSDVFLRYVFNRPIEGAYELTEYMMAIVVGFGLAYCAMKKGHISIELVVQHFPQRAQAIIDTITYFIGLVLFALITWQYFQHVPASFESGRVSVILYLPMYPFVAAVLLGSAALTLALLTQFAESLSKAVKK